MSNRDGNCSLSYAPWPDDADEPVHHQLRRYETDGAIPAYHTSQPGRQPLKPTGGRGLVRWRRVLLYGTCRRRDKRIASTRDVYNVADPFAPITERLPKGS